MRIVSEQIAPYVTNRRFLALGTDVMGRSDTREALRRGCDQHGIKLSYRPPGLPHSEVTVEST